MDWTKTTLICSNIDVIRTSPVVDLTMAHLGSYNPVPPTTPPTLEEAYRRITWNLANIEDFVRRHMTVGHLPEDPWRKASNLQRTIAHHISILKTLWHTESHGARFENLCRWIAVVEDKVRAKFKTLELFMQLRTWEH